MNHSIISRTGLVGVVSLVLAAAIFPAGPSDAAGQARTPARLAASIVWYGQAAVSFVADGKTVYVDPLNLPADAPPADLILVTHPHGDHFSPNDLTGIAVQGRTLIAGPAEVVKGVADWWQGKTMALVPGQALKLQGVAVETVPAYNVVKAQNHPKAAGWMGFVVVVDGLRLYHAGDTERIPEMKAVKADVALLPLGQTYTMNSVREAADAALDTGARVVIPIHWGMYEGSRGDVDNFAKLLPGKLEVAVLERKQ